MTEPSEYERGVTAGGIAAQLSNHERRLEVINGSIVDGKDATLQLKDEIYALRLAIQQLADQAKASAETATATAAALKAADEASWLPWQKALALLGGLSVVVGTVLAVLALR